MKHVAQISCEFLKLAKKQWWSGKSFPHPETRNRVKFKSLPLEEQRRLNALHDEKSKKQEEQGKSHKERLEQRKEKNRLKAEKAKARAERKKQRLLRRQEKAKKRKEQEKELRTMTPESHPHFFTKTGQRLSTTKGLIPGVPYETNPKWDKSTDNCYYCIQTDPKTGVKKHFYTEAYMIKTDKKKFANNQRFGELLPSIRQKYNELLDSDSDRDRVYATAVSLVDHCALRIGNKKSEEDDVRGLHNLQKKHMTITGNTVNLHYVGKTKKEQSHTFDVDDKIKRNLQNLLTDKNDDDPIFTWNKRGKSTRIAPTFANRFFKRKLGSNVTIHHFRHYHGTRTADQYLKEIDVSKLSSHQLDKAVREATVLVSEFLGNTPNVARRHYIDSTVFQMFYKRAGKRMPKKSMDESMTKTAAKFSFKADSAITGLTPQEQSFQNRLFETVLEDLPEIDENDNLVKS